MAPMPPTPIWKMRSLLFLFVCARGGQAERSDAGGEDGAGFEEAAAGDRGEGEGVNSWRVQA